MAPRHTSRRHAPRWVVVAVAALSLVIAAVGGLASLAAVGGLERAHRDQAVARLTYDNVELIVQARLDEALVQPSIASTSTEDEDLAEELAALVAAQPAAQADAEELRAREQEMREATVEAGATDERLLSRTVSSLDQLRRTAVRPFGDDVDDARRRARRTITATTVLTTATALATVMLLRRAQPR